MQLARRAERASSEALGIVLRWESWDWLLQPWRMLRPSERVWIGRTWRAWVILVGAVAAYLFAATFKDPADTKLPATALGSQALLDLERAALLFVGGLFLLMVVEAGYRGDFPKSMGLGGMSGEVRDVARSVSETAQVDLAAAGRSRELQDAMKALEALMLAQSERLERLESDRRPPEV